MYSQRTTPQEDIDDLQRLIRRVQEVVDDRAHVRNGTARDLLLRLHTALQAAQAKAVSSTPI
jgi:hypothetical protein